jgi:hypothetical protein
MAGLWIQCDAGDHHALTAPEWVPSIEHAIAMVREWARDPRAYNVTAWVWYTEPARPDAYNPDFVLYYSSLLEHVSLLPPTC